MLFQTISFFSFALLVPCHMLHQKFLDAKKKPCVHLIYLQVSRFVGIESAIIIVEYAITQQPSINFGCGELPCMPYALHEFHFGKAAFT